MDKSRDLVKAAGFNIVSEHPIWMGQRFPFWNSIRKWLVKVLPRAIAEDYLTSKYAFVLASADHDQIDYKNE